MFDVDISIDSSKLEKLSEKVMGDAAGAMGVMMAYIGDQTGIYKKMEFLFLAEFSMIFKIWFSVRVKEK